ncbi:YlbG family protein [Paenibacillus sp. y28]|uniref:YlbG family protein n=1 Tax=Paenibacillus sp. y28 TaxID=3129110 RepID=UPI00301ABBB1
MMQERTGLIVWLSDNKFARNLERFGNIHYVSKKMHYVVVYMNSERADEAIRQLQKQSYVKKIERSLRSEIPTEYNSEMVDKTRFYSNL